MKKRTKKLINKTKAAKVIKRRSSVRAKLINSRQRRRQQRSMEWFIENNPQAQAYVKPHAE